MEEGKRLAGKENAEAAPGRAPWAPGKLFQWLQGPAGYAPGHLGAAQLSPDTSAGKAASRSPGPGPIHGPFMTGVCGVASFVNQTTD